MFKLIHISPQAIMCLCVGESKKDKWVQRCKAERSSKLWAVPNAAPLTRIGPTTSTVFAEGVWHPVVCPLNETIAKIGYDLTSLRKSLLSSISNMLEKN